MSGYPRPEERPRGVNPDDQVVGLTSCVFMEEVEGVAVTTSGPVTSETRPDGTLRETSFFISCVESPTR